MSNVIFDQREEFVRTALDLEGSANSLLVVLAQGLPTSPTMKISELSMLWTDSKSTLLYGAYLAEHFEVVLEVKERVTSGLGQDEMMIGVT